MRALMLSRGAATTTGVADKSRSSSPNKSERSFTVLDTFRGFAAFYVLIYHASAFLGARRETFGGVLTWGVQVVLFFFVLSGFCIHLGQARALACSSDAVLDVRRFARRRFWRIYPPFLGALCLTLVVDKVGLWLNPSYYAALHISLGQLNRPATWEASTFLGNVLCLQPGVPTYGSNGPLWSLGYEAVFYAMYPIYFSISKRFGPVWTLGACFSGSFLSLVIFKMLGPYWAIPFGAVSLWGIWAMGAALADVAAGRLSIPARWPFLVGGAMTLFVCASRLVAWPNAAVQNYSWGVAWTLLIFWISQSLSVASSNVRGFLQRFAWSGRISYSLYLAHAPIVTLLLALVARGEFAGTSPATRFALTILAGTISGLILYFIIERHFSGVQRRQSEAGTSQGASLPEAAMP